MGDYYNIIHTAKEEAEKIGMEKGLAEGREKGQAEGRAEAQIEMARKMLDAGMPIEQIAEFTGLTIDRLHEMQY